MTIAPNPSFPDLNAGVRAVLEHAGFIVGPPNFHSENIDFVAYHQNSPQQAQVVACLDQTAPVDLKELMAIADEARAHGFHSSMVVTTSQFTSEAIRVAASLNVSLTDRTGYLSACEKLPKIEQPVESIPHQSQELTSTQTVKATPPPLQLHANNPESPNVVHRRLGDTPSGRKKTGALTRILIFLGVMFIGLPAVAIVAAIAIPNISTSGGNSSDMRNAMHIANVEATAREAGLKLVGFSDGTLKGAIEAVVIGGTISEAGNPHEGYFFGVSDIAGDQMHAAARYLKVENDRLVYTGGTLPDGVLPRKYQPTPPAPIPPSELEYLSESKQTAAELLKICEEAKAAGIDFVRESDGVLPAAVGKISAGAIVADQTSPYYGKYFGPEKVLNDVREASYHLKIEDGNLVMRDKPTNPPHNISFTPPDFYDFNELAQPILRIPQSEKYLVELNIPDDAPTWKSGWMDDVRAHYTAHLKLESIESPGVLKLANALVFNHTLWEVITLADFEKEITELLSNPSTYPEVALELAFFLPHTEQTTISEELEKTLRDLDDPVLNFQCLALRCDSPPTSSQAKQALKALSEMLDRTDGLANYPDIIKLKLLQYCHADPLFRSFHTDIAEVINSHPKLDLWLKNLVSGRHHIFAAWEARGEGYAHTVSEAGWKKFYENLALAKSKLTSSWEQNPHDPRAASSMITVSMGLGSLNDCRTWFNRTTAIQADYMSAYSKYSNALQPRWQGSRSLLAAFGKACLETGRFDTQIPSHLIEAHAFRSNDWEVPHRYWYFRSEEELKDLNRLFEGNRNAEVPPQIRNKRLSWETALRFVTRQPEEAFKVFEENGQTLSANAFATLHVSEQSFLNRLWHPKKTAQASAPEATSPE